MPISGHKDEALTQSVCQMIQSQEVEACKALHGEMIINFENNFTTQKKKTKKINMINDNLYNI